MPSKDKVTYFKPVLPLSHHSDQSPVPYQLIYQLKFIFIHVLGSQSLPEKNLLFSQEKFETSSKTVFPLEVPLFFWKPELSDIQFKEIYLQKLWICSQGTIVKGKASYVSDLYPVAVASFSDRTKWPGLPLLGGAERENSYLITLGGTQTGFIAVSVRYCFFPGRGC